MMNDEEQLADIFRSWGNTGCSSFLATVKEVGKESVEVEAGDGTVYFDVQLIAAMRSEQKNEIVTKPTKGSTVIVSSIKDSNRLYVSMYSEIDEVNLKIMNTTIDINKDSIVMNGGQLGGLIDIAKLTNKVNELVKAYNEHTHTLMVGAVAVTGSPSAQTNTSPITVPAITSKQKELSKDDYEDIKIKH